MSVVEVESTASSVSAGVVTVPFMCRGAAIVPQQTLIHQLVPHSMVQPCQVLMRCPVSNKCALFQSRPVGAESDDEQKLFNRTAMRRLHRAMLTVQSNGVPSDGVPEIQVAPPRKSAQKRKLKAVQKRQTAVESESESEPQGKAKRTSASSRTQKKSFRKQKHVRHSDSEVEDSDRDMEKSESDSSGQSRKKQRGADSKRPSAASNAESGSESDEEEIDEDAAMAKAVGKFPADQFGEPPAPGTEARKIYLQAADDRDQVQSQHSKWLMGASYGKFPTADYNVTVSPSHRIALVDVGSNAPSNSDKFAVSWLKAAQPHAAAEYFLGTIFYCDTLPGTTELGMELIRSAGKKGLCIAKLELGDMLLTEAESIKSDIGCVDHKISNMKNSAIREAYDMFLGARSCHNNRISQEMCEKMEHSYRFLKS